MASKQSNLSRLVPVMFTFFTMGFVDMVGTATNYVKADFALSDTVANFLPSMVFLWFFFLSVPVGLLMNRIGKRKTVLLSLVVTALAMVLPLCAYNYPVLLASFCLLGIGNTLMQVSLNPLITCIVSGEKLASTLTFGQFIKAIASFIAPIIASWASVRFGNWQLLYPIFLAFALIATAYLSLTKIEEEIPKDKSSNFVQCLKLLGDGTVLLLFLGIVAHVGIDVGVNTCVPKIMMERLGLPLEQAGSPPASTSCSARSAASPARSSWPASRSGSSLPSAWPAWCWRWPGSFSAAPRPGCTWPSRWSASAIPISSRWSSPGRCSTCRRRITRCPA